MGKVAEMNKKKKKKGRPSLLDLKKRSLRHQQKQQEERVLNTGPDFKSPISPNLNSDTTRRSTRRNPSFAGIYPSSEYVKNIDDDDDEDDDERKEKKVKLVVKLPSHIDHNSRSPANSLSLNSVARGSDSNEYGGNYEDLNKKRKINAVGDRSVCGYDDKGEKASKATDTPHGSRLQSGPTTPLPDKKLLVFILDRLQKKDTYAVFSEPVDPKELPDYHDIIKHPMDFGTVRKKLEGGHYSYLEQFEADIFLICANAMQYNSPDTIYFRQARSIQELAKRDFENLRQESDDSDPQPKVVRRGRPPSKNLRKSLSGSTFERVGPEFSSDATLATGEDNCLLSNSYNLRKGSTSYKLRAGDAPVRALHRSRNIESSTDYLPEGKNEFSASILKGGSMKYGKKQLTADDNRRDSYKQSLSADPGHSTALDGQLKQLVAVGLHSEHGYARSLARFAANLGPAVWKIASKKIESTLPTGVKFGPGWVGENDTPEQMKPLIYTIYDGHPSRPPPSSNSCSNTVLANGSSLPCKEVVETRLNSLNEFSVNSFSTGIRPVAPFQIHHNAVIHPSMNGINSGVGSIFSPQPGTVKADTSTGKGILEGVGSIFSPQPGTVKADTSTGKGILEGASFCAHMLGMVSGSNATSIAPMNSKHLDSDEPKFWRNLGRVQSGNASASGFGPESHIAPEMSFNGTPSWRGVSSSHKQDSVPVPPDLNIRFQSPGSPSSTVQICSLQQPDLALQL